MDTKTALLTGRRIAPLKLGTDAQCFIRGWKYKERAHIANLIADKDPNWPLILVTLSVCDEAGNPLFTEAELEAVKEIDELYLSTIIGEAFVFNRLDVATSSDTETDDKKKLIES